MASLSKWLSFVRDLLATVNRNVPPRRRARVRMRAAAIVTGIVSAFVASVLIQGFHFWLAIIPTFLVLAASLFEFVVADILTDARHPVATEELLNRLDRNLNNLSLHETIKGQLSSAIGGFEGCDSSLVSATLHLVVEHYSSIDDRPEKALLQITTYSGPWHGKRWRFTAATKGLIGRCLRTSRIENANFWSREEYELRMVEEFGFTKSEVQQHSTEARSYLAIPVRQSEQVIGVLYFFTTEPQVFPYAANTGELEKTADSIASNLRVAGII